MNPTVLTLNWNPAVPDPVNVSGNVLILYPRLVVAVPLPNGIEPAVLRLSTTPPIVVNVPLPVVGIIAVAGVGLSKFHCAIFWPKEIVVISKTTIVKSFFMFFVFIFFTFFIQFE